MRLSLRRASVAALSALTAVVALAPLASPAGAASGFAFQRYAGANRFDTARLIAVDTFGTAQTVFIATGTNFPDALAGSYPAGSTGPGAPILLTLPDTLPAETSAAIQTLGATRATILGGVNAVSAGVEAQLRARGMTVDRIQGPNRYDTAKAAAERPNAGNVGSVDGLKTAIVASGRNFPDALAGGPLAYSAKLPTLLTEPDVLVQQARDAFTSLAIKHVLLLGGPNAVSEGVAGQIRAQGITVTRLEGATRQGTAVAIAEYAKTKLGFVNNHINLARGDDFADALAMGPHGGKEKAPIVLTGNPTTLTTTTRDYLVANSPTLTSGHIAGGTSAVSDAVAEEARIAATGTASRATVTTSSNSVQQGGTITGRLTGQNITGVTVSGCGLTNQTVTRAANGDFSLTIPASQPAGQCNLVFTTTFTDGTTETDTVPVTVTGAAAGFSVTPTAPATQTNGTTRSFTATGLGTEPVDIALFRCENVTNDSQGNPVFTQSPSGSGTAGQGSPASTITTVNGATSPATSAGNGGTVINNVTPQNGQITFTVTGPASTTGQGECVTPVVFRDANTNNTVDVTPATGRPTETFATGGNTTFQPGEATAGAIGASDVRSTDKTGDQFVACLATGPGVGANPTAEPIGACGAYKYDSNDTFTVDGISVGIAAFEAALSPNDDVSGSYTRDPAGVSQFNLIDEAPLAPGNVSVAAGTSGTSLVVSWDDSLTPTVDAYQVFRLTAVNTTTACPTTTANSLITTEATPRTFTSVATVPDKSGTSAADGRYSYTDSGLTAGTRYCYIVRSIDDLDQSTNSDTDAVVPDTQPAQFTTGTAPTNPGAPRITDVRAQDGGSLNLVDGGDVHQFIFSEPMAVTVDDAGSTYRVADADGTIADIVCGTNAACFLQPAGTFNGTAYPANQVLRVNITAAPAGAQLAAPGTAGLAYPVTITSVSSGTFKDADEGIVLDFAGSPDKTIEVAAITPAANTTAPTLVSATGTGSTLTTNWSEGVIGITAAGFTVHTEGTCLTGPFATGTAFVSDNGDPQLGVTTSVPLAPGPTYFTKVAAGSVRDIDGNLNAAVLCLSTAVA